jgi:hypothetical protein
MRVDAEYQDARCALRHAEKHADVPFDGRRREPLRLRVCCGIRTGLPRAFPGTCACPHTKVNIGTKGSSGRFRLVLPGAGMLGGDRSSGGTGPLSGNRGRMQYSHLPSRLLLNFYSTRPFFRGASRLWVGRPSESVVRSASVLRCLMRGEHTGRAGVSGQ